MDYSNKTLMLLLVATLLVSLGGTIVTIDNITGRATDNGNLTLTVNTTASLTFLVNSVNFGSGYINVTSGASNCTLESTGAIAQFVCVGFTNVTKPLVILNNGNRNLSVSLNSSTNNTNMFGGTLGGGPQLWWNISNNGTSTTCAAQDQNLTWWSNWTNATMGPPFPICGGMQWQAPNNALQIHFHVRFVSDGLSGQRNATITAVGTVQ